MCTTTAAKSVNFSIDAPIEINVVSMPAYILSSSIRERMWYNQAEMAEFKNQEHASGPNMRCFAITQSKHRRDMVQTVLVQQEEHREELGSADEKGLRMIASALSKPDQKKALQLARLDALEAYDIHNATFVSSGISLKSIEDYSKRTTFQKLIPSRRILSTARYLRA
jgi:hypothetical protein